MEKARRLLSVMVTEARTSLWSLRERDPEGAAAGGRQLLLKHSVTFVAWIRCSSDLLLSCCHTQLATPFSISLENVLVTHAKYNSA